MYSSVPVLRDVAQRLVHITTFLLDAMRTRNEQEETDKVHLFKNYKNYGDVQQNSTGAAYSVSQATIRIHSKLAG